VWVRSAESATSAVVSCLLLIPELIGPNRSSSKGEKTIRLSHRACVEGAARRALIVVLCFVAALADCQGALAQEAGELLARAEEALAAGDAAGAAELLTRAIEDRPVPAAGTAEGDAYLPYLLLGVAYQRIGRYVESLDALATSSGFGASTADPSSLDRLERTRALAEQGLLAGDPAPAAPQAAIANVPPEIQLSPHLGPAGGVLEVATRSLTLSGVVVDDAAVHVEIDLDGRRLEPVAVEARPAGETTLTSFEAAMQATADPATVRIRAIDEHGEAAAAELSVLYRPPWFRRASTLGVAAALVVLGVAGLALQRRRRRSKLLNRKFNPYVAGPPLRDHELFVGREALVERVLQTVHNNSIMLFGERGIGKTSVLYEIQRRLAAIQDPDYDFYTAFVDLGGVEQERFFHTLGDRIFEALRDELAGSGIERPPGPGSMNQRELVRWLRKVLRHLDRASPKKVKLVLVLDDVDTLNDYDPAVNQQLRSLFMKSFADKLVAVVAGIGIQHVWESVGSPWYNFFEEVEVPPLDKSSVEALVVKPLQGVFGVEKGLVEGVFDRTGGHPFRVQQTCLRLVSGLHDAKRTTLTLADLDGLSAGEGSEA
jgi:hypothetical protein